MNNKHINSSLSTTPQTSTHLFINQKNQNPLINSNRFNEIIQEHQEESPTSSQQSIQSITSSSEQESDIDLDLEKKNIQQQNAIQMNQDQNTNYKPQNEIQQAPNDLYDNYNNNKTMKEIISLDEELVIQKMSKNLYQELIYTTYIPILQQVWFLKNFEFSKKLFEQCVFLLEEAKYGDDEIILDQNSKNMYLYIILNGEVRITYNNNQMNGGVLCKGQIFNDLNFISGQSG
ncbi:Cyclic nucleotide-binding protein [Pseudocohnilembus persalinus]|uniref:Cyclic nucleotide-binding protein n=1 Tax=Pseudocohnilembus persalinus TaxID=266149 RepID=A0A0V0QVI5_PSEPJ|nr:Cyclic nucleotide-binding protein [Pseudocohnilembus persalinus]|eukprot:KRX06419.1 Cyclic nucleotide-binding protein [Pseudocohnilembus persalinus]